MAIGDLKDILHKIKVKLYPNYLPKADGAYIARTDNEAALRELAQTIHVEIEGMADLNGYIGEFIDYDEESINTLYVPGDQFAIHGHKIKVAGDDPGVGIFFVPVDDPTKAVRVTRVAENTASKITGITPKTKYPHNRIEIITQFAGSGGIQLKTPRVITSHFILDET